MKNNLVKQNCGWKKTGVNDGLVTLPLGLKIQKSSYFFLLILIFFDFVSPRIPISSCSDLILSIQIDKPVVNLKKTYLNELNKSDKIVLIKLL